MAGKKIVIDTDVGSDDAMAIILCVAAQRKQKVQIVGITCVHGNTGLHNVCANTLKTLHTLRSLDIPVYRGAADSIVKTFERAANIHGSDGFGDFEYPNAPDVKKYIQPEHAVNYLTRVVAENPGVGNITAAAEFNFYCDPEAAFITIHNMKCPITIFPWEAAYKYGRLTYDWRKNVLGSLDSPQARLMNKVERVMLDNELYGIWARCDPMAAAILLVPEVATEVKKVYVTVELHGANTRGALVVDHLEKLGLEPNVTLIERVDKDLYKKLLLEAFSAEVIPS
ncbi:hypothetical protein C0J52_26845 [Blattella germanica]|nr:hypothetical protein C0J52_26845 [Blattella germanica]